MLLYVILLLTVCSHFVHPHLHHGHSFSVMDADDFDKLFSDESYEESSSSSDSSYDSASSDSSLSDSDSSYESSESDDSSSSSSSSSSDYSSDYKHYSKKRQAGIPTRANFPVYGQFGKKEKVVHLGVQKKTKAGDKYVQIKSPYHLKKAFVQPLNTYVGY